MTQFSNDRELRHEFFYKNEAFIRTVGSSTLSTGKDDDFAFHNILFEDTEDTKEEISKLTGRAVNMCHSAI
jgi:hypothetical protein